jgi:hypothetical protein
MRYKLLYLSLLSGRVGELREESQQAKEFLLADPVDITAQFGIPIQ